MLDSVPSAGTTQYCELAIPARNSAPVAIGSVVVGHSHRSVDFERMLLRRVPYCALVAGTIAGIVQTAVVSYGIAVVC